MPEMFVPTLPQTRLLRLARIRRERLLPVRGSVLVQANSRVGALDIVAKSDTVGRLRPVPLGRYLHTTENELVKYLVKKPGDQVQPRDVIASKPELFGSLRRTFRAPSAGRVAALQGVWLTLDLADKPCELPALYRGTVVNIVQRLGVVIDATGAWVQGVWGEGGEGYGVLRKVVDTSDQILTEERVDLSSRGVVLLAGAGATEGAIRRAAQEHAAGLVVGGLAPQLRELVKTLGLPTVVTDGLGERPMAAPFFELLASLNGDEAVVNTFSGASTAQRPEVFIPALATGGGGEIGMVLPPLVAQVGAMVRVIGGAHLGECGKIVQMADAPRALESGAMLWGAQVDLLSSENIFIPWDNLELIG